MGSMEWCTPFQGDVICKDGPCFAPKESCTTGFEKVQDSLRDLFAGRSNGKQMHAQYVADFSDDKALIGASHNVFVGKVLREVGKKERGIGPETQFEVEIIENIKGGLTDTVIVNQQGGYKDGVLHIVEGVDDDKSGADEYMLRPGSTYLFATRHNEKENWHTLNSYPTARKLLSANADASSDELKDIANNDSRVEELREAYPNEILLPADVQNNRTLNSYGSQSKNEKETPSVVEEEMSSNTGQESSDSIEDETSVEVENVESSGVENAVIPAAAE